MRKTEQLKKYYLFTRFLYEVFINILHGVNFNQSTQRKFQTEPKVICNNGKFFKVRVLSIYFAKTENICFEYIPYCLLSMLHTLIMEKIGIFFKNSVILMYAQHDGLFDIFF